MIENIESYIKLIDSGFDYSVLPMPIQLAIIESIMIKEALRKSASISQAAKVLGIKERQLVIKIYNLGISEEFLNFNKKQEMRLN